MPELPEVETIKLGLSKKIIGKTIKQIEIRSPRSFLGDIGEVKDKKIIKVWRRAKMLGLDLGEFTLLFHLKMTGQLVYDDGKRFVGGHPTPDMRDSMPNSHTRVIFEFNDGSNYVLTKSKGKVPRSGFLYFNDQRSFGWIKVVRFGEGMPSTLGPEPLEKEFNWQTLKSNLLNHKSQPVKVALMDQSVVAGIGNIYASEACFNAKIDPRTKVKDLNDAQFKSLHRGVINSLRDGIRYGGSTKTHFVDSDGHKGYFLDYAYVYGKDKHPCKKCNTIIKKIQLGGRGTYFCPNCQKLS